MKKAISFLLLINGLGINLFAQNYVDIAKFNYGYIPDVSLSDSQNRTDVQGIDVGVMVPIKLSEKIAVITGVDVSDQAIEIRSTSGIVNLRSAGIRLGVNVEHSNKWSGIYVAIPKVAGDFGDISGEDFQIGGAALWKYSKKENVKYKFGIYASTESFGLITTPIVGGYYLSPNKKFEANVSLPVAFDLNYKVVKPLRFGVDFNAIVRSYDLSESALSAFYVHRWVKELSAYMQFDFLNENLILKTKLVYAMNDFGLYQDNDQITLAIPSAEIGDNRIRLNNELGTAFGIKASLIYRFQLKNKKAPKN